MENWEYAFMDWEQRKKFLKRCKMKNVRVEKLPANAQQHYKKLFTILKPEEKQLTLL
jgi:hypothetical protein